MTMPTHRPTLQRLAALMACGMLAASGAGAATLFEDDFEAYAAGSNLLGQGGWSGLLSPVQVNDSALVGGQVSRVLDGLTAGRLGPTFGSALRAFERPAERYTLAFDAFSFSTPNTWAGLSSHLEGSAVRIDTGVFWAVSPFWSLVVNDRGQRVSEFRLPFSLDGQPVHLSITVDPVARQVFGTYPGGEGRVDTPTVAVSQHFIDALDGLNIGVDYRVGLPAYPGLQIDNLRVATASAVPEGGTRGLVLAGAAALIGWLRCRAPGARRRLKPGVDVHAPHPFRTGPMRA